MAYSNNSQTRENLLKVKSYSINQAEVLGNGAFGVVFKGFDAKQKAIAAKRIDGNKHPRILTQLESQDLDRFVHLDHPNVMKILDVERKDQIVWMMTPLCEFDLNEFYKTREVSHETNLKVMKQIMMGIEYLHSENIVHRDITPGNILVASVNPLHLKLADFDVCKCLDPEVETSLMTSNVGTLAFKAPEFFQRTSPGKIEYHRNVDIYAAGLIFLAILQMEKRKQLIPRIETPQDDSEFHAPSIGQLIAERIKNKVPKLDIVRVKGTLTKLISKMTCVKPRERLSAADVLNVLNTVDDVEADFVPGVSNNTANAYIVFFLHICFC